MSKEGTNEWSNSPSAGVADIFLPAHRPEDGHPNTDEIRDITTMEGFFYALFTQDILEHIVEMTNLEMFIVKTVTSNMSQETQNKPVYKDICFGAEGLLGVPDHVWCQTRRPF